MKKEYSNWKSAPLAWHKFLTYVTMPITFVCSIAELILIPQQYLYTLPMSGETITYMYCIAIVILSALAFIGGLPKVRKWYGPISAITSYFLSVLYSLYFIFVYIEVGISNQISQPLGAMIAYLIFACLNILYYQKRKNLFCGPTSTPASSKPQIVNTDPNTLLPPARPVCSVRSSNHFSHLDNHPFEQNGNENSVDLLARIMAEQEKENLEKSIVSSTLKNQKQKIRFFSFIFMLTLSIALAVSLTVVCIKWHSASKELGEIKRDLEQTESVLSNTIGAWEEALDKNDALNQSYYEILMEYRFYHSGACIVTQGETLYHSYGCQHLNNMQTYWIYNVEYAEYLGYEACPDCQKNSIENRLEEALQEAQEQDKQPGLSDHNAGR